MVKLPQVVGIETGTVDGETIIKQMYADGSYGLNFLGDSEVAIHYPDASVRKFDLKDSDTNDYYLAEESLSDGTKRAFDEDGLKYFERLPNGEERKWDIFFNEAYIQEEIIPGEVTRKYRLTGRFSLRGRLLPGTEYNFLFEENFANGHYIKYYRSRKKIKAYEKLPDGTERNFYESGKLREEKLPDGTERNFYESGKLREEKLPDGTERNFYESGKLHEEKLPDGTVSAFYENGNLASKLFSNGSKIEYYPSQNKKSEILEDGSKRNFYENGNIQQELLPDGTKNSWYEDGSIKSRKLPDGTIREWDNQGRIIHEFRADKSIVDYKYDENGNLTYHAVNGVEDTVKFLAMKKVAERQAEKSEKLRAQSQGMENAPQTVKKLNVVQKAVQMAKARIDVKREIRGR